jgi:hypothetical protein
VDLYLGIIQVESAAVLHTFANGGAYLVLIMVLEKISSTIIAGIYYKKLFETNSKQKT